jgi:hypothetical protein
MADMGNEEAIVSILYPDRQRINENFYFSRYNNRTYRETVSQFGFIKIEGQKFRLRLGEVDTLAEMITPTNLDPKVTTAFESVVERGHARAMDGKRVLSYVRKAAFSVGAVGTVRSASEDSDDVNTEVDINLVR